MILGLLLNDASLLPCQLDDLRSRVQLTPPGSPDAVGAGYVQNGQVLLRKRPATRQELVQDPLSLLADVQASGALVQVRRLSMGRYDEENTLPFRYGTWLFGHSGRIEAFTELRPALLERLPGFLRRSIQGDTDSEHVFALFLARLKELAFLEGNVVPPTVLAAAMGRTILEVESLVAGAGGGEATLNLVATNGRSLVAARRSELPVTWHRLDGLDGCRRHGLSPEAPDTHPWRLPHANLRSLVVTTGVAPDNWTRLADREVMAAGPDLEVHRVPVDA